MTPEAIGRYRVTNLLGRGGFAVVYLANDPFVKRQVAVKVLPAQFTDTAAMRARFQQEAEIIAALEHSAIVPIYDYGDHEGQPFIVMRYMAGGSLAEQIQQDTMGLDNAARVIKRISSALERAHDQGIVHRDLKPGNILFDQYGEAYLSDFGIARLTEASLKLTGGGAIGTPAYMSPEQVYGDRPVDGRSDIYALGVILFEMLTGTVPYDADTPAKLMMKHILEPVPRILAVKPDLPQGCENLLERAMAKEPEKRFSKATDFAAAVTLLSPTRPGGQPVVPAPQTAAPSEKPAVEATVIETPTPPEVKRMAEAVPGAAETLPMQAPEAAAALPVEKPTQMEKGRPFWFRPGLIAVGALFIIVFLIAFVVVAADLLNGPDTADPANENTSETVFTGDPSDNGSGVSDAPRATAASTDNLPQAEGVLTAREVGSFEELARLGRGFLTGLAVNPDGSMLAAGSGIGVWLYDTATLEPITLLEGHHAPVNNVAWSPDGRFLASAGRDQQIKIWDVEAGQAIRTLEGHQDIVTTVAWSSDGRYLASGGFDSLVIVWNAENGQTVNTLSGHEGAIRMVAWPHGNSEQVASASEDTTVKVWNIATGEHEPILQHGDVVEGVFWSADDSRLITGSDDTLIRLWDAVSGEIVQEWLGHEFGLISMALSPNGRRLVTTGNDGFIRLWNPETGEEMAAWSGTNNNPMAPAWLSDSNSVALTFSDNWLGIWQADNPQETLTTRAHTGQVSSVAWMQERQGIVSGHPGDDLTHFWDAETAEEAGTMPGFTGEGQSLSISADGNLLARPAVGIYVFDLSAGLREDIEPVFVGNDDAYVNVAALAPDAGRLAAINWNGLLRVWDLSNGQTVVEVSGAGAEAMAWSPDGRLIASPAANEPAVVVWDSESGEALQVVPYDNVDVTITGLDWSPDGRFLAASDTGGQVRVWERDGWGLALTFQSFGSSLNSLDWSGDGRWLASGAWTGSVYVWDATGEEGGDPVLYLDLGHLAPVVAVAWSPDSTVLASGSHDGTVRVWGEEDN